MSKDLQALPRQLPCAGWRSRVAALSIAFFALVFLLVVHIVDVAGH